MIFENRAKKNETIGDAAYNMMTIRASVFSNRPINWVKQGGNKSTKAVKFTKQWYSLEYVYI